MSLYLLFISDTAPVLSKCSAEYSKLHKFLLRAPESLFHLSNCSSCVLSKSSADGAILHVAVCSIKLKSRSCCSLQLEHCCIGRGQPLICPRLQSPPLLTAQRAWSHRELFSGTCPHTAPWKSVMTVGVEQVVVVNCSSSLLSQGRSIEHCFSHSRLGRSVRWHWAAVSLPRSPL